MGLFDAFRKQNTSNHSEDNIMPVVNPAIEYDIREVTDHIYALQESLDKKALSLIEKIMLDSKVSSYFDFSNELKLWFECSFDDSNLFCGSPGHNIDDSIIRNYFNEVYTPEIAHLLDEFYAMESLFDQIDEFKFFKVALFNIFNNANDLPLKEYFKQIFSRAEDYNITIFNTKQAPADLYISYAPFKLINRSERLFTFNTIHLSFNENFKNDGYVYHVDYLEGWSAYSGGSSYAHFDIFGDFEKFNDNVNQYCADHDYVFFHDDAIKDRRAYFKAKYHVPDSYFEAHFIDTNRLIDYSPKSFRYGDTNIFIPKSQVVVAGEKLFTQQWLYYKLRNMVSSLNRQTPLEEQVNTAESLSKEKNNHSVSPAKNTFDSGRDI